MTALWIAHVKVTDAEAYGRYARLASEIIPAHGGVWLARGGAYVQLEAPTAPVSRGPLPSLAAAEACYRSPEYQAALEHARGAAERELVLVEELGG
jgi:uncharacterized protein (DUF1330 family)